MIANYCVLLYYSKAQLYATVSKNQQNSLWSKQK